VWHCLRDPMFSRFSRLPTCDKESDRQTHDYGIYRASMASRGKNLKSSFFIAALWNRAGHYIFILWFLLSSSFFMVALCNRADHYIFALRLLSIFFSSPNLSRRRLDVYHTSTHGVALVRIENACLKCAASGLLQMQDPKKSPKIAIWAPSHNFVGLYLRN